MCAHAVYLSAARSLALLEPCALFIPDAGYIDPPDIVALNCFKLLGLEERVHSVPVSGKWINSSVELPNEFRLVVVEIRVITAGKEVFYHCMPISTHPGMSDVHLGVVYNVQTGSAYGYRILPVFCYNLYS
jgi:hypothetical protein